MRALLLASLLVFAASAAGAAGYDDLNIGIQYFNLRKWSDAIAYMDKALGDPTLSASQRYIARYDRGTAYDRMGQYNPAIADYSAALELRPHDSWAILARAITFLHAGKVDDAATDFDVVIAMRPTVVGAYLQRAIVNVRRGQTAKANEDFKTALSLLHDQPHGRSLGVVAWQAGNISDADENFRAGIGQQSGALYSWIWYALTQTRLDKDIPRRAVPDVDRKAWPGPIADYFLGTVQEGAVFAAASLGDESIVEGQLCEANFYLGEWKMRHKNEAGAAPLLRKAAADCPANFVEWAPAQLDAVNLP